MSNINIEIDEKTGLPELPEGYFWRVVDGHETGSLGTYPGIEMHIMKHSTKLHWFKRVPCVVSIGFLWKPREDMTEDSVRLDVVWMAKNVYDRYKSELPIHNEVQAAIEKYVGDYPPKNIND